MYDTCTLYQKLFKKLNLQSEFECTIAKIISAYHIVQNDSEKHWQIRPIEPFHQSYVIVPFTVLPL